MKKLLLSRSIAFGFLLFFVCKLRVSGHGHSHSHAHHNHDENPSFKYSRHANMHSPEPHKVVRSSKDTLTLWIEAIGSTLLISAAPFVILFFIPLDNSVEHGPFLKVLLSFASGGLLGDAFLHLIPHALLSHSDPSGGHSHSESGVAGHDLSVGLGVLGGIVVFLMVEKFVRIVKGGHGHSHFVTKEEEIIKTKESDAKRENSVEKEDDYEKKDSIEKEEESEKNSEKPLSNPQIKIVEDDADIKVSGYLNLAADFTHNFTDGLAIGASYLAGSAVGYITTVTILLHEVPHEVGDFAILIQSGCSKRKAIMLQFLTAIGALAGTCFSLMAEGIDESVSKLILPFTAGGFIYIATVSVIPELLEDTKFWQSVKEVLALLAGVSLMVLIAQYE